MSEPTLGEIMSRMDEDAARAAEFYATAKGASTLKAYRAVVYRCPKGCLLADVLTTPGGIVVHQPAYKLSPRVNAESSNASGRAANTTDGDRKWKAHTFPLSHAINITCTCDHVFHRIIDREAVAEDAAARRGVVIVESVA